MKVILRVTWKISRKYISQKNSTKGITADQRLYVDVDKLKHQAIAAPVFLKPDLGADSRLNREDVYRGYWEPATSEIVFHLLPRDVFCYTNAVEFRDMLKLIVDDLIHARSYCVPLRDLRRRRVANKCFLRLLVCRLRAEE